MTGSVDLITVRLLQFPLELYRQASEHQDELHREFALLQHPSSEDEASVPRRLRLLIEELNDRFGDFSAGPRSALATALDRGENSIDVEYRVPPEAREAVVALGALLDEADDFCRRGTHLLTLATPPGPLALRRWYLGQFVAQIEGADPTPWDQWEGDTAPGLASS
ncbi:MAG TPA: hypothetical protein VGV93_04175 [Acidimicrobiales bacterium]|nr:hypothetical protein [Acidimicrobiales bacterium]